jgi:3-(3-hydroxy-phenyl)propionate hydroxylase
LIGCDGARSLTRKTLGIELEDLQFDQPWLVVDTMLKREVDLPEAGQQVCDPARPTTFIPSRGNHRRWEFMLMPGDDPEEICKIDHVWELLRPWVGPDDTEVIRHVVYSFHGLIAERWRDRRVFLAGDAAHQMPPFLGQGMCSGIRDVVNLAWKLDLVMQGQADDSLLDTYQAERSPHVREITRRAMHLGSIIQTTDSAVAKQRDKMFAGEGAPGPGGADPLKTMMPGLTDGLLEASDKRCGQLFPQGVSRSGEGVQALLDEFIGARFAVITDAATAEAIGAECAAAIPSDVALVALGAEPPDVAGFTGLADESGAMLKWLDGAIAVVRPDRYVFGVAPDAAGLADLIGKLAGQMTLSARPVA